MARCACMSTRREKGFNLTRAWMVEWIWCWSGHRSRWWGFLIATNVGEGYMTAPLFTNHFDFAEWKDFDVLDSEFTAWGFCLASHWANFRVCKLIGIDCEMAAEFSQRYEFCFFHRDSCFEIFGKGNWNGGGAVLSFVTWGFSFSFCAELFFFFSFLASTDNGRSRPSKIKKNYSRVYTCACARLSLAREIFPFIVIYIYYILLFLLYIKDSEEMPFSSEEIGIISELMAITSEEMRINSEEIAITSEVILGEKTPKNALFYPIFCTNFSLFA